MPRFRPRISILTALLLMTIVGMAIVIVQLWREVGLGKAQVHDLRSEMGALSIEDNSKLYAIEVRTNESLYWKWRVWVPEGKPTSVRMQWGNVPKTGVPNDVPHGEQVAILEPGERWVAVRIKHGPVKNTWSAALETALCSGEIEVAKNDRWWEWESSIYEEGVEFSSQDVPDPAQPFVLKRLRAVHNTVGSSDPSVVASPTSGFIIWLDH